MDFRRKNLKVRTEYNILNFPALFLALVSLPFCPPGRYCWTVSAEKMCGKIQNVVLSSDFENFSPEIHALVKVELASLAQFEISLLVRSLCEL